MIDYLKHYKVRLTVVGPVHIGSGREILKTEYIFLDGGKKIAVMDMAKLYKLAIACKHGKSFEQFMSGENRMSLKKWLDDSKIDSKKYLNCAKYVLDSSGVDFSNGTKGINVMEFVKDAYGKPYVPGSSIKGMLRTILLSGRILANKKNFDILAQNLRKYSHANSKRNYYLKSEIEAIEQKAFFTLKRDKKVPSNAVNDELSGLIVSDSKSLEITDLMLGQKVDCTLSGKEMNLPILRECLKQGSEIEFSVSIDTTICRLNKEEILKSIELFNENYYECFLSAFAGATKPESNAVYLGGGSGFATKTVIYPLYGKKTGVPLVSTIFKKTMNDKIYKKHVHESDVDFGISPHIAKYTEDSGALFEMGLCRLEFI